MKFLLDDKTSPLAPLLSKERGWGEVKSCIDKDAELIENNFLLYMPLQV